MLTFKNKDFFHLGLDFLNFIHLICLLNFIAIKNNTKREKSDIVNESCFSYSFTA